MWSAFIICANILHNESCGSEEICADQRRELEKGQEMISKANTSLRSATVGRLFIVLVYNLTDKRTSGVEMHGLMRTCLRNNSDQAS